MSETINEAHEPPMHEFTVCAHIDFRINAYSIEGASREFTQLMTKLFNDAYGQTKNPIIVPEKFDTLAVIKHKREFPHVQ